MLELFEDRALPFDVAAARQYADLAVTVMNGGRGFPALDGYLAVVAASRGFIVASHDTSPYEAAGVTVINPWRASGGWGLTSIQAGRHMAVSSQ